MKFAALLLAVCLISHENFAQSDSGSDRLQNIHTVAIISALGDDIAMQNVGDFRWDTKPELTWHTGWKIDNYITKMISDDVGSRFKVVQVPNDPTMIKDIQPSLFESTDSILRDYFAKYPPPPGLDAYIIVHPWANEAAAYHWTGLGLFHSVGLFGRSDTQAHANYRITIVDAKTGNRIDWGTAKSPAAGIYGGHMLPLEACDKSIWSDSLEQLTDLQKQQIKDEMMTLVTKSLPYALKSAHLIDKVDASTDMMEWEGRPVVCHSLS